VHTEVTYFRTRTLAAHEVDRRLVGNGARHAEAAGHAQEVELRTIGKRRRRHQAQAAVAGHGIARLGEDVGRGAGQAMQHL
jgi:hypothetical protein